MLTSNNSVAGGGVDTPRSSQNSQQGGSCLAGGDCYSGDLTPQQTLNRAVSVGPVLGAVIDDLALQLEGKWRYQCTLYAEEHPEEELPDKTQVHNGRARLVTRTLPIAYAEQLVQRWIPWAAWRQVD